jgi:hypothetical protein
MCKNLLKSTKKQTVNTCCQGTLWVYYPQTEALQALRLHIKGNMSALWLKTPYNQGVLAMFSYGLCMKFFGWTKFVRSLRFNQQEIS